MSESGQHDIVTGAVLAGGRSSRLGRDKALLELGGETLLARAVRLLAEVCPEVIVVAEPERQAAVPGVRVVPDEMPGQGPLGGIATALRVMAGDRLLVIATDMPLLAPGVLRLLIERSADADLTIPYVDGFPQHLCAVYARACLPLIDVLLKQGDYAIYRLLTRVRVRGIDAADLRPLDSDLRSFRNINREEDWREVRRILDAGL